MLSDFRFALRTLAKSPAFSIAAVLCLTLGIGVNATIFSCVRAILLRPFPYRAPDELVAVGESNPKRGWHMNTVSYPNFRTWQADNRTLESVGIYSGSSLNLATGDGADYVQGGTVSWTMFHVLGVSPALGRDFREEEDRVGAPKVLILSDRVWRDRFEARPDTIGRVALGAKRSNVLALVLGHGAVLAGAGIGIGLAGALGVTRFLRAMLYGVSPFDPMSFVGVTFLLSVIAFLASYVPARRAARVDPVEALRQE